MFETLAPETDLESPTLESTNRNANDYKPHNKEYYCHCNRYKNLRYSSNNRIIKGLRYMFSKNII